MLKSTVVDLQRIQYIYYVPIFLKVLMFPSSIIAAFYVLFLTVLSFALLYGSTREDPTHYSGSADRLRAVCEICSVVFLMFHLFEEIVEIARFVKQLINERPVKKGCTVMSSNCRSRFT
jgi:hypothetical protein